MKKLSLILFITQVSCGISSGPPFIRSSFTESSGNQTNCSAPGPLLHFTNGQSASVVIGQSNFTSGFRGTTRSTLRLPTSVKVTSDGKLLIADQGNNRILGFNSIPTQNNANADFVIGQKSFTESLTGTSAQQLNSVSDVEQSNGKLIALDSGNNRIPFYDSPSATTNPSAMMVVGQTLFGSRTSGCGPNQLNALASANESATVIARCGKLLVTDSGNNRVLIYSSLPSSNGTQADLVIGQPSFSTCSPPISPTASSFESPGSVWTDGVKVVVADPNQNRVLIWNTFPTSNGQPANVVLGQPDKISSARNEGNGNFPSAQSLNFPTSVVSNGIQLFVFDGFNGRILIWNQFPFTDNTPADQVLGTTDLNTVTGQQTTASTFYSGGGLSLDSAHLFVSDYQNSRVLIFNSR